MTETVLEFHPREWVGFLARLEALHRYAAAIGAGERPLYLTKRDEGIYNFFVVSEHPDLHDFALHVWGSQSIEAVDTPFPDAPERYRFNPKWRIAGDKAFADPKGRGNVFLTIDHLTGKASTWRASAGREAAIEANGFARWQGEAQANVTAERVGRVVHASVTADYNDRAAFWLKTGEMHRQVWKTVCGIEPEFVTHPFEYIEGWVGQEGIITLFTERGITLHETRLSAVSHACEDAPLPVQIKPEDWRAAVDVLLWREQQRQHDWKCRAHTLKVDVVERGLVLDIPRFWLRLTLERPAPYTEHPSALIPCRAPTSSYKPTLNATTQQHIACQFGQSLKLVESVNAMSSRLVTLRSKAPTTKRAGYTLGEQLNLTLHADPDHVVSRGRAEWRYSRTLTSEKKNGYFLHQPHHARGDDVAEQTDTAEVTAFEQKTGSFCMTPAYLDMAYEFARQAGARAVATRWSCSASVVEVDGIGAPYRAYIATVNRWEGQKMPHPEDNI